MHRRLIQLYWPFSYPPHHPERLPTFTPLLLGSAAVLLALGGLADLPLPMLLAPIALVGCVLLPWLMAIALLMIGMKTVAIATSSTGDILALRQLVTLSIVVVLSPWVRTRLLRHEWQEASQRTLATLIHAETANSPEQSIGQTLASLQTITRADAAIALRQLDAVTAEVLLSLPEHTLPSRLTTPTLFAEAIAQNHCLFYPDYPQTANAAPALVGQGIQSVAVMPLQQSGQMQGAILLLWRDPARFSVPVQQFVESLQDGLSHLLQFQDITLRLEKLKARLVAILETIPQGIVFMDEGGEEGWLNHTASLQLHLPQGAVEPMAIAQAMAALRMKANNPQELGMQAAQFFSQPNVQIRDWQWSFSQPSKVLSLSSTPIDLRQVPGRLWVLDDITERKQAEVALQQSEERFQLIARATNDAVWDWDLTTNTVWWNEGIETLFGYSESEVGQDITWWHNNIHPADQPRIINGIHAAIAQGQQSWADEYRYRRADGSYACVSDRSYVIHAPDGTPTRMLGGMTDITERKQAQEELQRQNLRAQLFAEVTLKIRESLQLEDILQVAVTEVRTILKTDRVLVYRLWPDGTGSGIAEEVLPGFPTVLGQTFPAEVFPEAYRHLYLHGRIQAIANVTDNRQIAPCLVEFVQQFQVKAKLVVPIVAKAELWGLLIAHQCDRPREWTLFETELLKQLADQIGIALTQAQLLEQETRQREELARSNVELQQFAYVASHDLQEPLRMVTSYLQLLERRYKDKLDADAHDFIGFAVDGASRMKTLIQDLLTYSRVGTHGKPFERVNCSAVVERAIANLKIAIEENNAIVTCNLLPNVIGDASQLGQLFQNLLSNAIKFRRTDVVPQIYIGADEQATAWQFYVRDNGIGIEAEYAERIFVIFQRLHGRTEYPGTGIGLAVCKKIVERHGGQIWIQSELGMGTTFYFTLPKQGELQR
ncbi:MAG TPA: ATP-binding protein [Crinalium sp.]|jgi:PAS domain S-box-containing protein